MEAAEDLVHGIDREADSAARHRQWLARWHLFLVRADFTRQVDFREASPGLHMLLAMLQLLEQYTPAQLKTLARQALTFLNPGGGEEAWNNDIVPTFRSLEVLGRLSLRQRC